MTTTSTTDTDTDTTHGLGGDYPTDWAEIIGQDKAKLQLMTAARSAKLRGVSMPHTLLVSGKPGIGKTSLALLAAGEMGAEVKVVSGKIVGAQARMLLAGMADGDCLIIDEMHQLVSGGKTNAEWLLHYLQDGVLIGPLGPETQPKVTVIGCTTDIGKLPMTVVSRFPVVPDLVDYTDAEAALIAGVQAKRAFLAPAPLPCTKNLAAIARAASNSPRLMRALLETLRDITLVSGGSTWNEEAQTYDLTQVLDWHGLTEDGLTALAQRYLVVLAEEFMGEPAGVAMMKERLQEPGGVESTERLLLDKGYIALTKRGRILTQHGMKRARKLRGL